VNRSTSETTSPGWQQPWVTLVEYGDYECPFCKEAEPIVAALRDAVGDHLRLVFRHFPVTNIHPHAEHAAEVAEAAGVQGKFWDLHPYLFAHQEALDDVDLMRYARERDLDAARVETELATHVHRERVREDLMNGMQSGVRETPTFSIDGIKYDGPPDLQAMLAVIRASHPEVSADIKETAENMRVPPARE